MKLFTHYVPGSKPDITEEESPFACDMTAIPADQREPHLVTVDELFRVVETVHELSNGYSFRLPNDSAILLAAAQFIALERLCCPFFGFGLEIEREGGGVWLTLPGAQV